MSATRRKPSVEELRRALCDAAIELLAEDGARAVTHLRMDRRAGVADGTTSFYYQTRASLLRAATDRVVAQDIADFTAARHDAQSADGNHTEVLPPQLAVQGDAYGFRTRALARGPDSSSW